MHVDIYGKPCAGVVVRPFVTTCDGIDRHDVIAGWHFIVREGAGCGTGVVVA